MGGMAEYIPNPYNGDPNAGQNGEALNPLNGLKKKTFELSYIYIYIYFFKIQQLDRVV